MANKKMSVMEAKGKLATLDDIIKEMDSMSMDRMKGKKGMAKVSVMSDSPEGLEKGLDTAKEVVGGKSEGKSEMILPKFGSKQEPGACMEEKEYEDDSEDDESMDELEDADEELEYSAEELDKKIAELLAKKKAKSKKQI
jgi:hypothetical protein